MAIVLQRPDDSGMSWLAGRGLVAAVRTAWQRRRRRAGVRRLTSLDDHMLDDIGVCRHEVDWAVTLPLDVDAAAALRQLAAERRRNDRAPWPRA